MNPAFFLVGAAIVSLPAFGIWYELRLLRTNRKSLFKPRNNGAAPLGPFKETKF